MELNDQSQIPNPKSQIVMKQPELNRRLSSLDAAFLYLERKECPMHIGSTSVFEGKLSYRNLVKHVEDRLHLIPRYVQKIVPDPFNLGHPTWETAEDFDIRQHIFEIKRKRALSHQDLVNLAGEILSSVLDRTKPLWELYIVNNLEGGRSAMIAKVHHAMVDGISGVDLIKILFDISPEPTPPPKPEPEPKKPKPDATQMLFDSLFGALEEGINRMMEMQGGLLQIAQALANPQTIGALPHIGGVLPAVATPPPILPFNGECSGERRLAWSEFSFSEARAIRASLGGSVNDVVLTLLSEAVSRYVESHNQPTKDKIVRFMVPVSLRQEEKRGTLGNLISVLPVEIPLDIKDLKERFKYVNQKTAVMKAARLAEGLGMLGALYGMMPAPLQSVVGAAAELPFPPFNMVATNVPGPQIPLYMCGQKMTAYYPYVPIGFGLGLGCAILSYDQKLYFGLSSDAKAMSDVEKFKEFLDESFADLRRTAEIESETVAAAAQN
jgi:diacylglycerol O-acyltransferase / wax synthase